MDNNNNNSKINRLIYDTLSLRRSILLPEIGVVRIICSGSIKNKPTKANDFPHYDIILTDDGYDVDLSAEISKFNNFTDEEKKKIIADWLLSIRVKNGVEIPNCFVLTKSKKLHISSLLNMQLNPFAEKKHLSKKGGKCYAIFALLVVVLACVIYFYISPNCINECKIEQNNGVVVVPNRVEATSIVDSVICDTTSQSVKTVAAVDSITLYHVKKDSIKNDNYIVVSSFKTRKQALKDKKRLSLIYKDIKIFTAAKTDGNIINYIFKSDNLKLVEEKKEYFAKIYPRIRGIWIYEMKNN